MAESGLMGGFLGVMKGLVQSRASPGPESLRPGEESVRRGAWGEDAACCYLAGRGWRILERNARPCKSDRRCEVDIIAQSDCGGVVFVEVKTHRRKSPYATRLWRVDRRKKRPLLRACACWIMSHHWHGDFRFDVIEVYGEAGSHACPEIDHVENVPLFGPNWRFWRGG